MFETVRYRQSGHISGASMESIISNGSMMSVIEDMSPNSPDSPGSIGSPGSRISTDSPITPGVPQMKHAVSEKSTINKFNIASSRRKRDIFKNKINENDIGDLSRLSEVKSEDLNYDEKYEHVRNELSKLIARKEDKIEKHLMLEEKESHDFNNEYNRLLAKLNELNIKRSSVHLGDPRKGLDSNNTNNNNSNNNDDIEGKENISKQGESKIIQHSHNVHDLNERKNSLLLKHKRYSFVKFKLSVFVYILFDKSV